MIIRPMTAADWPVVRDIYAEGIALHLRHGFRAIGTRERIGQSDGVWRDVVLLERRSAVV